MLRLMKRARIKSPSNYLFAMKAMPQQKVVRGKNLMCISLFLELLVPALQPAEFPAHFPLALRLWDFLLSCPELSPSHTQQRNLCVVGDFFFPLRWRFILTAQLAQIYFLQNFTN